MGYGTVYALMTGMETWYSVPPSNLGVVTEVWCSEVKKTWGDFSTFELSHPQTKRSKPGEETGNSGTCPRQRKGAHFKSRWKF